MRWGYSNRATAASRTSLLTPEHPHWMTLSNRRLLPYKNKTQKMCGYRAFALHYTALHLL